MQVHAAGLSLHPTVRQFLNNVPLLPAIAYCAFVWWQQELASFRNFEYAQWEGNDNFALTKLRYFLDFATGLRADRLDAIVLGFALINAVLAGRHPRQIVFEPLRDRAEFSH